MGTDDVPTLPQSAPFSTIRHPGGRWYHPVMDSNSAQILDAMEQAAMSGLCRDGQLEIGVQAARALYPEMSEPELLAIAESLYKQSLDDS